MDNHSAAAAAAAAVISWYTACLILGCTTISFFLNHGLIAIKSHVVKLFWSVISF